MRATKPEPSQEPLNNSTNISDAPQVPVNGNGAQADDPFSDLDSLRIGNFSDALGKKLLTTVPVRKPGKQDFLRVRPEPEFRLETAVLELKEEREVFLVSPPLREAVAHEISPRVIFTCLNRQGIPFLWPVRRPDSTGRIDSWSTSAISAAQAAMTQWVRVSPNMSLGGYDVFVASGDFGPPEWPALSFQELLRLAFKDKFIDRYDHPVLRRLRGEV